MSESSAEQESLVGRAAAVAELVDYQDGSVVSRILIKTTGQNPHKHVYRNLHRTGPHTFPTVDTLTVLSQRNLQRILNHNGIRIRQYWHV